MDRSWMFSGTWALAGLLASLAPGCSDDPLDMGGPRSCSIPDRNEWMHGLMEQVYLWNDELPVVDDPRSEPSPADLMAALRIPGLDRWSRVADKARSDALFQEGKYVGLGFRTRRDTTGRVRVASVAAGSPADAAGISRGDVIEAVADLTVMEIDTRSLWGEIYGPNEPGVPVDLTIRPGGVGEPQTVYLLKDWVDIVTVPLVEVVPGPDGAPVGVLAFESFVGQAEDELDAAFAELREAGVRRLIVDLRYNGGGLLSIAHHLGRLLAGRVANGARMYRAEHNQELRDADWSRDFSPLSGSLDLKAVAFITTRSTASASELVINALRPHLPVYVVGDFTSGKPVGFHDWDMCDQKVMPITFRMLNADDEGYYYDGLTPSCPAPDDLDAPRNAPYEASTAAALALLAGTGCPSAGRTPRTAAAPGTRLAAGRHGPSAPPRADGLGDLLPGAW